MLLFTVGCGLVGDEDDSEMLSAEDMAELHDPYVDDIAEDEKALAGGRAESGYAPTGFLYSRYSAEGTVGLCSATLIRKDVVITAAHCVGYQRLIDEPGLVEFHLGKSITKPKITRKVKRIKVHPRYKLDSKITTVEGYDVAILYLAKSIKGVKYAKLSKKPIKLAQDQDGNSAKSDKSSGDEGASCNYRSVGYGVGIDKQKSNGRRSVKVCALTRYGTENEFTRFQTVGGVNCGGDSGGPIFREKTLEIVAVENGAWCNYDTPTSDAFAIEVDPSFFGTLLD